MKTMHCGKASTHFLEKAKELENIVLTNKTYQTTRFVRSLLRGITAGLRNLPTLIAIIGEDYNEAILSSNNTEAKNLKNTLDGLMSAETLFFAFGLSQLLESYSAVSLECQYASHFPIQVWQRIELAKTELQQLAQEWIWNNSNLKLAGIGTPQKLITSVLRKGSYEPFVPLTSIRRNKTKSFSELLAEVDDDLSLFDEENQQVLELAGSTQINNANAQTLENVERKLKEIAQELYNRCNLRLTQTDLQRATVKGFGQIHEDQSAENVAFMIELLQDIISCLPTHQGELFDAQVCYPGLLERNTFWKNCYALDKVETSDLSPLANVHTYYENWVKKLQSGEFIEFRNLFEIIMIRSTSEAICETVGSMMGTGKNRNLEPEYFSMEMVLRFNLGPLHLLDSLIDEILSNDPNKS